MSLEYAIQMYKEVQSVYVESEICLMKEAYSSFYTGIEEATDVRTLIEINNQINRELPTSKAKKMLCGMVGKKIKEMLK